ncbi:D-isomer specific 2-hydroxyacid dehydrogenase, catalytic domain-containing protein [Cladophialophora immunda]|nr:D-isomer specific 2-hydroxyacid dehydrogenase, catalytic domain-containing protein [Cladophialophora immunda]
MKAIVYSTHHYDQAALESANQHGGFNFELTFHDTTLTEATAVLATGFDAVCVFVNDQVDARALKVLAKGGVKVVVLRCAGYNNVDTKAATSFGITVLRVPAYSPYSVAEFTVGLLLALDRKICRAWLRIRLDNFSLDGLLGRDLHGKVVGILGTGRIGSLVAKSMKLGFGCDVIACDPFHNTELESLGIPYVDRQELFSKSDILCLHCPLSAETHHIIDADSLAMAKPGMLLVNTSRGGLIDTKALIAALQKGTIAGCAIDVYEEEACLFFRDLSNTVVRDDAFQRLITFPNVLVTGHQAFFTQEALGAIAQTTLQNLADFDAGKPRPEMEV